jgi:S-adenosylmethionine hydrolase
MTSRLITLITDFGLADHYVGAMKGAILTVNAQAQIIDITHEIAAQDVMAGAFAVYAAYKSFPVGTIHVCVVDPGVGSRRRAIVAVCGDYFFVGPDNGLFSYVYEAEEDARVYQLTHTEFFRHPVSATFHGRDIFAPVAAALAKATVEAQDLGEEITDYVRLASLKKSDERLRFRIIHIDRFGNCITNITPQSLPEEMIDGGVEVLVNEVKITRWQKFFAEEGSSKSGLFMIWGSTGFLEIVAFQASAARLLNAQRGDAVKVVCNQ